ncbi:estradiol 17-beta-dehydrogenase 8 isoform X2 [Rhipicephalus microplus]|uniref:estradiol 17-beta-dehydrogenase 8 isoform X2 n=1 Tax=Rhipicephalus microplus TaxID=6941 RepID=UPI003F6D87CB
MSLDGRLALVTGGASGIGEAVCRALAEEGAAVVVADKHIEAARQVAASLPALPLSAVVNCAGIIAFAPIMDCSEDVFDDIIRVNLKGTFLVIQEASRYILRSGQPMPEGGAAIVNVASIFGKSGQENAAAYCASKGGIVALTKSAAQELAPHNIRCNAVLPGCTETPMNATAPGDMRAEAIASTPLKRMAQPREIAEAIKFLCLPKASSFVTGAALEVTGGWRMLFSVKCVCVNLVVL